MEQIVYDANSFPADASITASFTYADRYGSRAESTSEAYGELTTWRANDRSMLTRCIMAGREVLVEICDPTKCYLLFVFFL